MFHHTEHRGSQASLGTLRFGLDVTLDFASPSQEAPQIVALSPHEFPELHESNLLHLYPGVGLDAPEKIGAAPRGEMMAFGGVPDEADGVAHAVIITTKDTKVHEGETV